MPLPLLAIGAVTSIAGGLLNAYSQYSSYQEQKATSKYNQAILDANQRIDSAMIDMDIRRIRDEGEELLGSQRAFMGKSGTKFSGSNIDVFINTLKDIELDVTTLELKKMIGASSTAQQKELERRGVSSAKKALPINIASGLLGTATNVLGSKSTGIAQSQVPPNTGAGSRIFTSSGSGIRQ